MTRLRYVLAVFGLIPKRRAAESKVRPDTYAPLGRAPQLIDVPGHGRPLLKPAISVRAVGSSIPTHRITRAASMISESVPTQ